MEHHSPTIRVLAIMTTYLLFPFASMSVTFAHPLKSNDTPGGFLPAITEVYYQFVGSLPAVVFHGERG